MRSSFYKIIARYFNQFIEFFDEVIFLDKLDHDDSILLKKIKHEQKKSIALSELKNIVDAIKRPFLLLNGVLNYELNIQEYLETIHNNIHRHCRIGVVVYSFYWNWLYKLARIFKIRKSPLPQVFLTHADIRNFAKLTNFEIVEQTGVIFFPARLFGIGTLINKFISVMPIISVLGIVTIYVLRPVKKDQEKKSLTIIIPARNEKGNIENALKIMPDLGCDIEIIFVEGNSSDGTWEEIQRVCNVSEYLNKYKLSCYKQPGKGKFDAVRLGFDKAKNDIITIIDADLTMPPELLPQFYNAYVEGRGDFINGSRLVYPMEGEAMRFLNLIGNKLFAKLLSFVLGTRYSDTLCGTKLFPRYDYIRECRWRNKFGDFDPFGDFEMLFSASVLKLGVIDIPVRYRKRIYGSTQISRFRDGLTLFKMTLIGFFKIKLNKI